MGVLENESNKADQNLRSLFAVPGVVDWDAMYNYGTKLIREGYTVYVHEHADQARCSAARPDGAVPRCGQLTEGEDGVLLVPVHERAATTEALEN